MRAHAGRTGAQRLVDAFACARLTQESALVDTLAYVHKVICHYDVDGKEFFEQVKATGEKVIEEEGEER